MSQRLILPINNAKLTASWKTDAYKTKFGMTHYGVDMVSTAGSALLFASGDGKVVATGNDSVLGNFLVVQYTGAYNRVTGETRDVICRMWHMASVLVNSGDPLKKDTKLGYYGNTGQYTTGAHLHMEMDTDIAHPMHTPTLTGNTANFSGRNAGANDSTMSNPLEWLYCKTSAPDSQTWATANDAFIRTEDKALPAPPVAAPDAVPTAKPDAVPSAKFEGIDVSAHNGAVNWPAVKAAGKNFAFIRLGWCGWDGGIVSNNGLDARFHENMQGALAAGLNVGVFLYSYAKTALAARTAARETLELIKPYAISYPVAFDIEDTSDSGVRYDKMTKAENNAIVKAFLSTIADAGYFGMLYTYKSFAESYLNMSELSGLYDTWIAQYADACTYNGPYGIWQHHGDKQPNHPAGSCPGVTGACDLNTAYKDYAAIIRTAVQNAPSEAEPPAQESELEQLRAELSAALDKLAQIQKILGL